MGLRIERNGEEVHEVGSDGGNFEEPITQTKIVYRGDKDPFVGVTYTRSDGRLKTKGKVLKNVGDWFGVNSCYDSLLTDDIGFKTITVVRT